ncbi:MAG: AAA family ATPase, partial [Nocardioides sp.]
LPSYYVEFNVELAYATTAYGAQGQTTHEAHVLISDHSGAAATYVSMTRGTHHNIAHLVADSTADARAQWISAFSRDRADFGPAHSRGRAIDEIYRYGVAVPVRPPSPTAPGRERHEIDAPAR